MDEILLYLSLNYYGEWMAIYDSLQKKEELKVYDIKKAINDVDADWITLISNEYPENLKKIYKPPFGLFVYGKSKLINQNSITIFGQINEANKPYIDCIRNQGLALLWVRPLNKEMLNITHMYPNNNIFYIEEIKNKNDRTFQNILADQNFILNNAICSEIWERKLDVDYSNQYPERIYLGLSLKVLIVSKLKAKEALTIAQYCSKENIEIYILSNAYDKISAKVLKANKVNVINNIEEIANLE